MDKTSAHCSKGDYVVPATSRKRKTPPGPSAVLAAEVVAKKPTSTDDAFGLGETSTTGMANAVSNVLSGVINAVSEQDEVFPMTGHDVASGTDDTSVKAIAGPGKAAPDVTGIAVTGSNENAAAPDATAAVSNDNAAASVQENGAAQGGPLNLDEDDSGTHYIEVASRTRNLPTVKVPYRCQICQDGRRPHTGVTFEGLWDNFINSLRESAGADEEWVNDIIQSIDVFIDEVLDAE